MAHPKFGERYTCFSCGTKFYDLKKPTAICPNCQNDQAEAPKKGRKLKPVKAEPAPAEELVEEGSAEENNESGLLDSQDEEPPYSLNDDGGVNLPSDERPTLTEIDPGGGEEL